MTARPHRTLEVLAWAGLASIACVLIAGAAGVLGVGITSGYYGTSWEARVEHPLHEVLRPGGPVGLLLGIVGTALMLAMLSYTVRKWLVAVRFLGPPTWWLRFHILCGIMGPIYIVLHAGILPPHGLVAVGFWCMLLVAFSGAFGRYVFGHFPKNAAGRALDLRESRAALADLREALVEQTVDADSERIGSAVSLVRDLDVDVGTVIGWVQLDLEVRRRLGRVRKLLHQCGLDPRAERQAVRTLSRQLRLTRNVAAWDVSRRLFKYWHLFHEPLAKAMYLITAVHVLNAILLGGALATLAELAW